MIIVHGHSEEGGGSRDERAVYLSPAHIVSVYTEADGRTCIISQTQTKDGSIIIAVEETKHQVANLKAAWDRHGGYAYLLAATACRIGADGNVEYLDRDANVVDK